MVKVKGLRVGAVVLGLVSFLSAAAELPLSADEAVARILQQPKPPAGVVFEIAVNDAAALEWATPKIQAYVARLRARFPDINLAVVTHGAEQFALQRSERDQYPDVHREVRDLVQEGVSVHVCETNAARRGIAPEAFPDYVNVSAEGPAQVKDYVQLGYTLIRIRKAQQ